MTASKVCRDIPNYLVGYDASKSILAHTRFFARVLVRSLSSFAC